MGNELKMQIISQLPNEQGYIAQNVPAGIFNFNFNFDNLQATVGWRFAIESEGITTNVEKYQNYTPEFSQEILDLIGTLSDLIHQTAKNQAFIPTPKGAVSFAELKSEEIVIGTVEEAIKAKLEEAKAKLEK